MHPLAEVFELVLDAGNDFAHGIGNPLLRTLFDFLLTLVQHLADLPDKLRLGQVLAPPHCEVVDLGNEPGTHFPD